ncbi:hypothetical protein BGK67_30990 [Streptomyces subrutilus]|uniref:Uncharacterized protein n=1 Tax=Streptomyces subrutilus TaxID=36818 RepID=A0A1E5Q0A8_9ACTN|nr:hypothetical protein BGK67_30990 [Streptomyces subrutilus]
MSGVPRTDYGPQQAREASDALETAVHRYMARIKTPIYTRRLVALLLPVAAREGAEGFAARTEIAEAYRRLAENGLMRDRLDHAEALIQLALIAGRRAARCAGGSADTTRPGGGSYVRRGTGLPEKANCGRSEACWSSGGIAGSAGSGSAPRPRGLGNT